MRLVRIAWRVRKPCLFSPVLLSVYFYSCFFLLILIFFYFYFLRMWLVSIAWRVRKPFLSSLFNSSISTLYKCDFHLPFVSWDIEVSWKAPSLSLLIFFYFYFLRMWLVSMVWWERKPFLSSLFNSSSISTLYKCDFHLPFVSWDIEVILKVPSLSLLIFLFCVCCIVFLSPWMVWWWGNFSLFEVDSKGGHRSVRTLVVQFWQRTASRRAGAVGSHFLP